MRKSLAAMLMILGASGALVIFGANLIGSGPRPGSLERQGIWQKVEPSSLTEQATGLRSKVANLRLNRDALGFVLAAAPHESAVALRDSKTILSLPMPDGSFAAFRIQEAPVLEPALANQFPEIKSYRLLGVTDPTMSGRFDLTPEGFHATILTDSDIISILPTPASETAAGKGFDEELYTSSKYDGSSPTEPKPSCSASEDQLKDIRTDLREGLRPEVAMGGQLRTYRIAIATTWEYSNAFGGTNAGTVASLNSFVNGLNAVYERELSVRVILVNNTNILFTTERGFTAATDPFTDNNENTALEEAGPVIDQQVGRANYNVGQVFVNTATGGVASGASVCGESKGKAASAMRPPAGNIGSVLHFAHELGHQFGAPHTYNGTGGCAGSRSGRSAVETGSGITIMSYAGICSGHNLEGSGKEARFHARSLQNIADFVVNGTGAACPVVSPTGNTPPTVTAPAAFTIPKSTPFILTATGNDPDAGDNANLTYAWEQNDAGGDFSNGPYNDAADPPTTTRPIFRPFSPTKDPSRTFPSLKYILANANVPPDTVPGVFGALQTAEQLPRIGRTLNFRVTVRDNVGGVNDASTVLTVDGNSGPFAVTAPNTAVAWTGGSTQNVTWSVAGTNNAPVSAANVKISLSTDGGQTFPTVLQASTPNNGAANVVVPNGINTTTARIKIEALGNIFFDISDANFAIAPGDGCPVAADINPKVASVGGNVVITGVNFAGVTAVRFGGNVAATFTVDSNTQITATVPAGAVGGAITLSKGGCGDVQTSAMTICPGMPATLQVDNGTAGGAGGAGTINGVPATFRAFNRLTPAAYPATISSVLINVSDRLPIGTPINIHVGANLGGTNNIDGTPLATYARTVTAQNNFATYQIPPLTIASGDFVVGYSYAFAGSGGNFDRAAAQNRSYQSDDGINFVAVDVNYMIRAQVFTGACTPASCDYNINPTTQNFAAAGGNGTVNLTAGANCAWVATRSASWINFTSATSGMGNAAINFTVAASNTALARTGTITVGGKTFTVTQDAGTAPTCFYTLDPAGGFAYFSGARTGITFNVITGPTCPWTAVADQPWITITGGATGTGNGTVTFSIAANAAPGIRSGSITVAGVKHTFDQFGGAPVCTYTLNPTTANLGPAASTGNTFAVNVGANCQWTAVANDNWITITGGSPGNSNGTVTFSVAQNTAPNGRVGTITVGGQAFTVNQAAAAPMCTYVLNPTNAQLPATASADNTFGVAAAAGCNWTAATNDNWITITGGANGMGNGTVTYSLTANPGAARNGTITVQGQNFAVTQAAAAQPCTPVEGGLQHWYRAENNALDNRGANNGTVAGTVNYGAGNPGQAFVFNGTDSVVSIQRTVADSLTIEFWFRTTAAVTGGANETDWRQGMGLVGTANDDFGISLGNGKMLFGVSDVTVASQNPVNDDAWHHIVAARNKDTGEMRLYIDGQLSQMGMGNTNTLGGSPQILFGRRGTAGAFFNGSLDEVKIYTAALTDDQAQAAFQGCAAAGARIAIENRTVLEGNPNPNAEPFVLFTVRLSQPSAAEIAVSYYTRDLTAINGIDYVGQSGEVVFPPGETVATISIPILADTTDEPDRQFLVELFDPINGAISDGEGVCTIIDDDSPCEFFLQQESVDLPLTASTGNTLSLSGGSCDWTAMSPDSWITITGGSAGNGSGTVTYSVQPNSGAPRSGTIFVAGKAFAVNQGGTTLGTAIKKEVGGGYRISFLGTPGEEYIVQFSPELIPATWGFRSVQVADENGTFSIVDNPGTAKGFYRAIRP